MKRDVRARWIFVTALLAALLAAPAPAQDQGQDEEQTGTPQGQLEAAQQPSGGARQLPDNAAEMVTDYLDQDIFLRPGVGLKNVKLGMPFEGVLRAWGEPASRDGGTWTDPRLVYKVGNHTRIVLSGDDSVESIRVEGDVSSPYTTTEGASFGMAQHQLATIYGAREARSGKVTYAKRGIGFVLTQGQVSEIRIFYPD